MGVILHIETTTINTQVNCNTLCSGAVSLLWLAEAFTTTHTPSDKANHAHFIPSYLICMWISVRQDMLASQNLRVYTCKLCPIVAELAISPMEGRCAKSTTKYEDWGCTLENKLNTRLKNGCIHSRFWHNLGAPSLQILDKSRCLSLKLSLSHTHTHTHSNDFWVVPLYSYTILWLNVL